jgi:hypothetical protein
MIVKLIMGGAFLLTGIIFLLAIVVHGPKRKYPSE